MEDAALQATLGQLCEEALDRVEPRTGRWREVECEARVPVEPCADFGVFVGGVIVEDHMHRPFGKLRTGLSAGTLALIVLRKRMNS